MALVDKLCWEIDPEADAVYPKAYPATLIATLNGGSRVTSHFDFPKGDPENPATLEDVERKFHLLTEKFLEKEKRDRIVEIVSQLQNIENVEALSKLLG